MAVHAPAHDACRPDGLTLVPGFLTPARQAALLARIDAHPWRADLRRRVQHHGWVYSYRRRRVAPSDRIGPLPEWLASEAVRLVLRAGFDAVPDQAIVNEYEPGQGIAAHVDCEPCFGDTIASLSLGGRCVMTLRERHGAGRCDLVLRPGSLLVLRDAARYAWTHEIAARRSDVIDGARRPRERRVSVTFRTVRSGGSDAAGAGS